MEGAHDIFIFFQIPKDAAHRLAGQVQTVCDLRGKAAFRILQQLFHHHKGGKGDVVFPAPMIVQPFMLCNGAVSYTHLDVYKRQEFAPHR